MKIKLHGVLKFYLNIYINNNYYHFFKTHEYNIFEIYILYLPRIIMEKFDLIGGGMPLLAVHS